MSQYPQLFWPGLSHNFHAFNPAPKETAKLTTKAPSPPKPTPIFEDRLLTLPRVEVRPSTGRGLGLFAVDRIPAYTRILEDDALLALKPGEDLQELFVTYKVLPEDLRADFDALSIPSHYMPFAKGLTNKLRERGYPKNEIADMVKVCCKFQGNSFNLIMPEDENPRNNPPEPSKNWAHGLFLNVARINHSCAPNAHCHYRPSMGAQIVQSIRDIEAGDEIEIAYFDILQDRAGRQQRSQNWGFQCACAACAPEGSVTGHAYETALAKVRDSQCSATTLYPDSDFSKTIAPQIAALKAGAAHVESLEYPWLAITLPRMYQNQCMLGISMAYLSTPTSDFETFSLMRSAYEWQCKVTGPDSPASRQLKQSLDDLKEGGGVYDLMHGQAPGTHAPASQRSANQKIRINTRL